MGTGHLLSGAGVSVPAKAAGCTRPGDRVRITLRGLCPCISFNYFTCNPLKMLTSTLATNEPSIVFTILCDIFTT